MKSIWKTIVLTIFVLCLTGCSETSFGKLGGPLNPGFINPQHVASTGDENRMIIDEEQRIWLGAGLERFNEVDILDMTERTPVSVHAVDDETFFILNDDGTGTYTNVETSRQEDLEGIVKATFAYGFAAFLTREGEVHVRFNPEDMIESEDQAATSLVQAESMDNIKDIEVDRFQLVTLNHENEVSINWIEEGPDQSSLERTEYLSGKLPVKAEDISFYYNELYVLDSKNHLHYVDIYDSQLFPSVPDPDEYVEEEYGRYLSEFPLKQIDMEHVTQVEPYGENGVLVVSNNKVYNLYSAYDSAYRSFNIAGNENVQDVYYTTNGGNITFLTKDFDYYSAPDNEEFGEFETDEDDQFAPVHPTQTYNEELNKLEQVDDPASIAKEYLHIQPGSDPSSFASLIKDADLAEQLIHQAEAEEFPYEAEDITHTTWAYTLFTGTDVHIIIEVHAGDEDVPTHLGLLYEQGEDGSLELYDIAL